VSCFARIPAVPHIELNVIDKLLNQPVFSPFRTEGTVKDSTRPVYVITGEEIEAQGARNVREAIRFLPGVLPDGTVFLHFFSCLSKEYVKIVTKTPRSFALPLASLCV
jgi:vitamin B12 transporter